MEEAYHVGLKKYPKSTHSGDIREKRQAIADLFELNHNWLI